MMRAKLLLVLLHTRAYIEELRSCIAVLLGESIATRKISTLDTPLLDYCQLYSSTSFFL
jgi:hypothetical protein